MELRISMRKFGMILSIFIILVSFGTTGCTKSYTLLTSSIPGEGGTIITNPMPGSDGKYASGTKVSLTAKQSENYEFVSWIGDASGTISPATVTMDGDKNVKAEFKIIKVDLKVSANPPSGGTYTLSPIGGSYNKGSKVTLTAEPSSRYDFDRWSGDITETNRTVTITMDKDRNVTVNFLRIYKLDTSINPSGGTISASPSGSSFKEGTKVTLTATPSSPDYKFDKWSLYSSETSPTITITMDGDKTVVANFVKPQFSLKTSVDPAGSGTISPSTGTYNPNQQVTLTATPASGYVFDRWSSDITETNRIVTITVDKDKNVTAYFKVSLPVAKITDPPNDASIDQFITVKGTANQDIPKSQYLWVLVQYAQEAWPQTNSITPALSPTTNTYQWSVYAQVGVESDRGKPFYLVALLVPQSIENDLEEWFKIKTWKGFILSDLLANGAKELDRVSVRRR